MPIATYDNEFARFLRLQYSRCCKSPSNNVFSQYTLDECCHESWTLIEAGNTPEERNCMNLQKTSAINDECYKPVKQQVDTVKSTNLNIHSESNFV